MGLSGGGFRLWGLRFRISLQGSRSPRVGIQNGSWLKVQGDWFEVSGVQGFGGCGFRGAWVVVTENSLVKIFLGNKS